MASELYFTVSKHELRNNYVLKKSTNPNSGVFIETLFGHKNLREVVKEIKEELTKDVKGFFLATYGDDKIICDFQHYSKKSRKPTLCGGCECPLSKQEMIWLTKELQDALKGSSFQN